jgi:hypothetical protein
MLHDPRFTAARERHLCRDAMGGIDFLFVCLRKQRHAPRRSQQTQVVDQSEARLIAQLAGARFELFRPADLICISNRRLDLRGRQRLADDYFFEVVEHRGGDRCGLAPRIQDEGGSSEGDNEADNDEQYGHHLGRHVAVRGEFTQNGLPIHLELDVYRLV